MGFWLEARLAGKGAGEERYEHDQKNDECHRHRRADYVLVRFRLFIYG